MRFPLHRRRVGSRPHKAGLGEQCFGREVECLGVLEEPILRPGSWIGGDRDGNPNVTADVVRLATGSAAYTALEHYFVAITALEQELSMSARLVKVSDELAALADASPTSRK